MISRDLCYQYWGSRLDGLSKLRKADEIQPGVVLLLDGWAVIVDSVPVIRVDSNAEQGWVGMAFDVSLPPDHLPRWEGWPDGETKRRMSRVYGYCEPAQIARAGLGDLLLTQIRHPFDFHAADPGVHLPQCCGTVWPCDDDMESRRQKLVVRAENQRRAGCRNCGQYIYDGSGRHIQFGVGTIQMATTVDDVPVFTGLRTVEDGDRHEQFAVNPSIVRFCNKSKCVTAARRFGEAHGCPIPGLRKDLERELRSWRGGPVVVPDYRPPDSPAPLEIQRTIDGPPVLHVVGSPS